MIYSKKVIKHFLHPKNFITNESEARNADGHGEAGNPVCGDLMKMWIWVKNGKIVKCKWKTFGCASAIASTSILSEMVKGMKISDALKLKPERIVKKLGGLPAIKVHCSVLGSKALKEAIKDYLRRSHAKGNRKSAKRRNRTRA